MQKLRKKEIQKNKQEKLQAELELEKKIVAVEKEISFTKIKFNTQKTEVSDQKLKIRETSQDSGLATSKKSQEDDIAALRICVAMDINSSYAESQSRKSSFEKANLNPNVLDQN